MIYSVHCVLSSLWLLCLHASTELWWLCVQAREYLYYKVFGTQETTPVAIMTSAAKGNHQRVQTLLAENNWFGRGKESFRHAPHCCLESIQKLTRWTNRCLLTSPELRLSKLCLNTAGSLSSPWCQS